jgi:putative drug exporter of the RND superfamily
MLSWFAALATRRPRAVVAGAVLLFVVAGAAGGGVADRLTTGGFEDPDAESSAADDVLAEQFDAGTYNVLLLVKAKSGDVDDPAVAQAGRDLTAQLAGTPDVTTALSYWSEANATPLRSDDGRSALVVGRIDLEDDALNDRIEELGPELRRDDDVVDVEVGGYAEVFNEVSTTIEDDLVRAEMIALPITLLLLVVIFGSVVAATLPVAIGILSIVGTFLVLRILVGFTDVSIYALNLTTMMGLGLAIDYSLVVVARYREELRARPDDPRAAVVRTVRTAGRTVAFTALTVAASLCATLVFPFTFLRSMAYAGVAVALLAGVFSLLVLPAILMLLGHRVNALTLWRRSVSPPEEGLWHRIATFVMRRPVAVAGAVIALLLVMGAPFLGLELGQVDDRVLPTSAGSRQVHDQVREDFSSTEVGALSVVATDAGGPGGAAAGDVEAYAARLAALPNVSRVDAATGTYCGEGLADQFGCQPGQLVLGPDSAPRYAGFSAGGGTYLSVVPSVEPYSDAGEQLVHDVRNADAPFETQVTGLGAVLVDSNDSLFARLPLALAIIGVITVVLLFLLSGSVLVPIKALVLNLLSLSATFGAMVWIFQEGHLTGLLDVTATGTLAAAMPILMFCVAFGLSMDYEVFLLSRIKEEHDRGEPNTRAVAVGLERTGRLVTAAALLVAVVFISFATGRVAFIKLFGVGLTLAVLLDAFVIRGTLVPAFMRLAGDWNWWAPGPLRRLHDRWGISEHGDDDPGRDGGGGEDARSDRREAVPIG